MAVGSTSPSVFNFQEAGSAKITRDLTVGGNLTVTGTISAGSNADTLDNLDSTQFVRSDAADIVAGILTFSANSTGGTIMSRTGYTDWIGYNANYGSYIAGGASNASKAIYASGWHYDGSTYRQLFHEGHAPTAAEVGALSTGGGTLTGQLFSQTIRPSANATFNLGVASSRYAYVYGVTGDFSGNVTVAGSCTFAALSGTTGTFSGVVLAGSTSTSGGS